MGKNHSHISGNYSISPPNQALMKDIESHACGISVTIFFKSPLFNLTVYVTVNISLLHVRIFYYAQITAVTTSILLASITVFCSCFLLDRGSKIRKKPLVRLDGKAFWDHCFVWQHVSFSDFAVLNLICSPGLRK